MKISTVIGKYISGITGDEFHRYKSWDNCFKAFSVSTKSEVQVLELAFYLASWGMYRGSSGLLQKNHTLHNGAVDILFSAESQKLKCNANNEVDIDSIIPILGLKKELASYYSQDKFKFVRGTEKPKPITPTDTLLSKIMLGTLGCVPAYDRYFIDGLKEMNMQHTSFEAESLHEIFTFIETNKTELIATQKLILAKTNTHYPLMKIIDIYFWQIGFDKELRKMK